MKQFRYLNEKGEFDLDEYRRVQIAANKEKISWQWVSEPSIRYLSEYLKNNLSPLNFGICHGTRRGNEQKWFKKFLGCNVLGTEISDTASQFADTIQWDFHEAKPEWIGNIDFIYSNSWDHSYDPERLFKTWFSCLREGGLCILEHTEFHCEADKVDPLGFAQDELVAFLTQLGGDRWKVIEILHEGPRVGAADISTPADHIIIKRLG